MDIFDQEIEVNSDVAKEKKPTRSNFFEVMLDYCFFENDDEPAHVAAEIIKSQYQPSNIDDSIIRMDQSLQFRSPHDLHELYIDKLQFFIDALNLMGERHVNLFNSLVFTPKFKHTIFSLLNKGETNLRIKCHEILEVCGTYFIQYCSSKTLYELAMPTKSGLGRRAQLLEKGYEQKDFEMMEVDFINHERMYISQMIIQCVRKSFEMNNGSDSYMQFNSLILLDYLFQNVLPVPSFQNEQLKARQNQENLKLQQKNQEERKREREQVFDDSQLEDGSSGGEGTTGRAAAAAAARNRAMSHDEDRQLNSNFVGSLEEAIDLETTNISDRIPELEVTDPRYTAMRLKLVYKLWPYVQEALNSPWSNIRSICYGLICSMLKIDIRDCNKYMPYTGSSLDLDSQQIEIRLGGGEKKQPHVDEEKVKEHDEKDKEMLESNKFYLKLRQFVIPMMINLLSSKESESKAGGLNILGSICGLSYDFSKVKISRNLEFFKRNSEFVSLPIWQLVFELQDDWDITIKEASIVLIQLCAPREAIKYFNKCKVEKENSKFQLMLNKMAKNGGGQGGHNSLSNLSSARQNSFYNHINSKKSFNNEGDQSNRVDYKQVDFGYKNKAIPDVPGLMNEFGKLDMATFLNDNQDFMNIDQEERKSEKKKLALNLDKVNQSKEEKKGGIDVGAVVMQSSLSQRSGFGNQQILMQSQQQNKNLTKAMQGSHPSQSSQQFLQPFDFFVDDYQDDQIQEIISIFRNDFKPPKNLWIEKAVESSIFNGPDFYADIYSQAIEQFNQQQMMLQQKQQQELQDQVSNGSSSSMKAGEFSPSGIKEGEEQPKIKIEEKESQNEPQQATEKEPEPPVIKQEEPLKEEKFDPSTDLNIFEQINFDEMNINLEDINQSNQKQDVINSSNSDIGDQGGDQSMEYPNSSGQNSGTMGSSGGGPNLQQMLIDDQKEVKREVEAAMQAMDELDTSNDMMIDKVPYEDVETSPQKNPEQEQKAQYQGIGTELQVIESVGEVSSNSKSQQQDQIDPSASMVSYQESEKTDDKPTISIQDGQIEQIEKKYNKAQAQESLNSQYYEQLQQRLKMVEQQQELMPVQQLSAPQQYGQNLVVEYPPQPIQAKTQVVDMSQYKDLEPQGQNSDSHPEFQSQFTQLQQKRQDPTSAGRNERTQKFQNTADSGGSDPQIYHKQIPKYPQQNYNTQEHPSKKQILKNFKQSKANNEDYIIMQNISNQMGGQIVNTTKSKKMDKSLESIFKKPVQKTNTSQGRLKPASQKSQDLSLALGKKQRGNSGNRNMAQTHRITAGNTKSSGMQKKTTSISPKRPQNEITRLLMGTHQGSSNAFNSTTSGNRKSHRSGNGNNQSTNLSSNQQNNSRKIKENMKDMNYFIKTIEKFSKKLDNHPKIKTTMSSNGGLTYSGSDPQTPKDVLINMGDQLQKMNSSKGGSITAETKQRKMQNKYGPSSSITAQQVYEAMLIQQQKTQRVPADTAESLKTHLKKNGFNLTQLNKILVEEQKSNKRVELTPDSNGNYKPRALRNAQSKSSKSNGSYPGLSNSPQNRTGIQRRMNDGSSVDSGSRPNNGRPMSSGTSGGRKFDKNSQKSKKLSFAPPPNLMLMNYSQTQKFDLREINKQLMQGFGKGGGSTQNKNNNTLIGIQAQNMLHSQREKSAGSAKSGGNTQQYNNLMLSNKRTGSAQVQSPKAPTSARVGASKMVSDLKAQKIPLSKKQ